MRFGPVPLAQALGAILAHSHYFGSRRLAKGRRLSAADVSLAQAAGLTSLVVAMPDSDDLAEDAVASLLGAALAGDHLVAGAASHGRVNLHAAVSGLVLFDAAAIDRFNLVDEAITVATLPPYHPVQRGDMVATIKIIPYAVAQSCVAAAQAVTQAAALRIAPFQPLRVHLVHSLLPGLKETMIAKSSSVMRARIHHVQGEMIGETQCPHDPQALRAHLQPLRDSADLILILAASATVDRHDVVPTAITADGGILERLGMPVDPGNLLCLGRRGPQRIIGLPGCARSTRRNGIDLVLERIFAGLPVDRDIIAHMGVGGLLPETNQRPKRRASQSEGRVKKTDII